MSRRSNLSAIDMQNVPFLWDNLVGIIDNIANFVFRNTTFVHRIVSVFYDIVIYACPAFSNYITV